MSTHSKFYKASISRLSEDCLGDKEYLKEIVALLSENMEEFFTATAMFLKANDRFSIARAGNKLRNGLAMIEAYGLLDYLDIIEHECQQLDTMIYIERLISDFKDEYLLVQRDLQTQIAMLHE